MPKDKTTPIHDWHTLGMRGTASEGYACKDVFVPEEFSGTREDPSLRRDTRAALCLHHAGPLCHAASRPWRSGSRAPCSMPSSSSPLDKTPRYLARLADNPVVQSDVARREADLGSARAFLVEILKDIWERADDVEPIGTADRAQCAARLHAGHPLAEKTADWVYKAAGTSAIFLGTPFERRFRDIHTLSQQIQSREAHFETVGRIMLNGDPDGTFLG